MQKKKKKKKKKKENNLTNASTVRDGYVLLFVLLFEGLSRSLRNKRETITKYKRF